MHAVLQRADCVARVEEVMHLLEQRAEKIEKLRRELEEVMQPVDGVAEARGRERSVASRCQLVEAIQQLGYLPRQGKNSTIEEKHLAARLIKARTAGLLSSEQEVSLGHLAQGAAKSRQQKYYQKNKARIVARQKEYNTTPHGKGRMKELTVAYYQKNKARLVVKKKENQRKYRATPHRKAKKK